MKIAIDFRIKYNREPALSVFASEFWEDMAALKPDHEFIFITDEKEPPEQGIKNIFIRRVARTGIKWLDKKQLFRALRNWNVNRFVTIENPGFSIQFMSEEHTLKSGAEGGRLVLFLSNDKEQPKNTSAYGWPVTVIKPACRNVINELPWAEAESIKTQYTGGRSFFLFAGNISDQHQLIELLKSFSVFKKWQQSNMQLVIAGYTTGETEAFEEKLQHYKYKSDVVLLKDVEETEIAKLIAASYTVVYPAAETVFPLA
ncbi:MAG: glycosyltransferase, partial [Bacteroidota bacterium]